MYCNTCGIVIDDCKFCANCGTATTQELVILPEESETANSVYSTWKEPGCGQSDIPMPDNPPPTERFIAPMFDIPVLDPGALPVMARPTEKYFFGKKALMFCLFVIAGLSVTCGMFIGLYLSEIGVI